MATNKIQTGIRFEPELLYKITKIAKHNKRSLNAQLEFLAQCCVEDFESTNGEIAVDENELYSKYMLKSKKATIFQSLLFCNVWAIHETISNSEFRISNLKLLISHFPSYARKQFRFSL